MPEGKVVSINLIGNLENSTKLFYNALTLPLHKNLTQEDQEKIVRIINKTLNN